MSNKIWIIGIGPGSKEFLTQAAIYKIEEQDLLVGSLKALGLFSDLKKETHVFKDDIASLLKFLEQNYKRKKIAILVTGDPGLYSLASSVKKHFNGDEIAILPGISSVQLFFARLGFSYENVKILSFHGRQFSDLAPKISEHKKVCILTDSNNNVQKIAQNLLKDNIEARAWVGQNISLPNELILQKSLAEFSANGSLSNALMYLEIKESK